MVSKYKLRHIHAHVHYSMFKMYALKLFGMVVFKMIPITFQILTKIFTKCSIRYIEIVKQILCTKKERKIIGRNYTTQSNIVCIIKAPSLH